MPTTTTASPHRWSLLSIGIGISPKTTVYPGAKAVADHGATTACAYASSQSALLTQEGVRRQEEKGGGLDLKTANTEGYQSRTKAKDTQASPLSCLPPSSSSLPLSPPCQVPYSIPPAARLCRPLPPTPPSSISDKEQQADSGWTSPSFTAASAEPISRSTSFRLFDIQESEDEYTVNALPLAPKQGPFCFSAEASQEKVSTQAPSPPPRRSSKQRLRRRPHTANSPGTQRLGFASLSAAIESLRGDREEQSTSEIEQAAAKLSFSLCGLRRRARSFETGIKTVGQQSPSPCPDSFQRPRRAPAPPFTYEEATQSTLSRRSSVVVSTNSHSKRSELRSPSPLELPRSIVSPTEARQISISTRTSSQRFPKMRENQYDTATVAPIRQRSHCGSAASATELPTYGFYDPTTKPRPSTEASPRPIMVRESPHSSPFTYTQHLQRRGDTDEEVEILATASSQSSSFALGLGPRAASSLGHVSNSAPHEALASRSSLQIDAQRSFSASGTAVAAVGVHDPVPGSVNESFPNAKARRLLGLDNGGWDDEDDEDDETEQNSFRAAWSANVKKRISVTAAKNSFNRRTSGSSNEEPLTEVNGKQAPRREEDVVGSNTVLLKVGKTIGINRAFRATSQEHAAADRCQTPLSKSKSPVALTPRKSTDHQYNANTPWTPPSSWALSMSPQMSPYGPTSPRTQKSQSAALSPSTPSPTSRKKTKPRIDVYLRRIKGHRGSSDPSITDPSAVSPSSPSPSSTSVSQRDLMLWERTLDSAERSASWQTAIEHRPRARRPSTSSTSSAASSMRSHPLLLVGSSSTLDLTEDAKSSTDHASTVRRRRSGSTTKEVPARGSSLDSRTRRLPMAPYPFGPAVTTTPASLRPHHQQDDALEMLDESAAVMTRGVGAHSSSTTGWTRSLSSDHAVPSAHSVKAHVPPRMLRGSSWDAKKAAVVSNSASPNSSAPVDFRAIKAGQSPRRPRRPPQAPLLDCHLQPPPGRPSNAAMALSSSSSSFSSSVGQQVVESPAESDWSRCPSLDQSPTTSESPAGTVASRSDEEWRAKQRRQWQEANETSPTPDRRPSIQRNLENLSLLGNVEESEEDQQWSKSGDTKDDACAGQRITFHAATPEVAGREPLSPSDSCFYFTADISDDSALPSSRDSGSYGLGIDAPTTTATVTTASDLIARIERDIRANKVLSLGCERRLGQSLLSLPEDEDDSEEQDDLIGGVIHFPQPPSLRDGHRVKGVSYSAGDKASSSEYDEQARSTVENPEEACSRKGGMEDMLIILPPDAKLGTAEPAVGAT